MTPKPPKTAGQSGGPGGLEKVQPTPPDVWKVSQHGLGPAGPLLQPPVLVGSHEPAPAANSGAHFCG